MNKRIPMRPIVRLVDDDDDYRGSQKLFLEMLGWQVRAYASAADFLAADDALAPGCLILDIRMPEMNGIELQRELVKRGASLPVIFLTGHGDVSTAVHAMKYGAHDFIEKRGDPMELKAAVEKAVAKSLESAKLAAEAAGRLAEFEALTPRDREVVLAAAEGASNKNIAEALGIGIATVKMHRSNAFAKLGVQNALEAYHRLQGLGLFDKKASAGSGR